jgi:integrase
VRLTLSDTVRPSTSALRVWFPRPGGGLIGGPVSRSRSRLTVKGIAAAVPGRLRDGGGLVLDKADQTRGKWVWRYTIAGRRREMGLGPWPEVGLAQARAARDRWAISLLAGRDPITERLREAAEQRAELDRRDPTLAEMVATTFEAQKRQLRGEGERGRWLSPLRVHVLPKLGARRIGTIHQTDIHAVLAPIWHSKPETAEKAVGRLRVVFRHAELSGLPVDARTIDAARHMLGARHHESAPITATRWQDIPALYARLSGQDTLAHLCLRLIILSAVRGDAARGARFEEFGGDVWTIPAERIKGRVGKVRAFRVPLSAAALAVVEVCRPLAAGGLLFPGVRGAAITSTALQKALNTLGEAGRPHGFRTSFRTWVQDTEAAGFDVAETALGHTLGGTVERSYARSDLLEPRRVLMRRWADFVTGAGAAVNVVPIRAPGLK